MPGPAGAAGAPSVVDVDDLEEVLVERWPALGRDRDGNPFSTVGRLLALRDVAWWRRLHRRSAREGAAPWSEVIMRRREHLVGMRGRAGGASHVAGLCIHVLVCGCAFDV